MKSCLGVFAILLAGCPPKGTSSQPPMSPGPATAGCPSGSDVYLASFLTQDDQAAAPDARAGWVLPLHDRKVDSLAGQPEYATIDAATAGSLGVPPAPSNVWLMIPGQPACKATVGAYYAAAVEAAEPNVTYGVALEGCAAPPREQQQDAQAIALVSEQAPAGCQVVLPQPVAARLGESDATKQWRRPTKETPIPPALAAVVPAHDCKAPGCEMLWSIAQVTVADRPVAWAGAINWLRIPPGATAASQCDWKAETFAGFFAAGPDGNAVKVTEGQDHPLLLSAVLADATGPRVLIAEGPGEYATYDLGGPATGLARLARHLVWLRLPAEAYAIDERIGPVCGAEPNPTP
jgi:hypothetical protein